MKIILALIKSAVMEAVKNGHISIYFEEVVDSIAVVLAMGNE